MRPRPPIPLDPSERQDVRVGSLSRIVVPADCRVPRDVEPSEREKCRGRIMARDANISRLMNRITALKVEQGADKALLAKLEGERHGRGRKPHHAD